MMLKKNKLTKIISSKLNLEIPSKLLFLYNIALSKSLGIINDPINNLFDDYQQIETTLKLKIQNIFNYFYFAKNKIHKILYDEEEFIIIEYDKINENIAYLFYLNLLINADYNLLNYCYSFDFINKINNNKRDEKNQYKSIILAKIVNELINNYKVLDEYDSDKEEELNAIQNENENIIKREISNLEEINLNINYRDINEKSIDEIYSYIINSLIINENFQNYEYIYNILKQLDVENIDITQTMFEKLEKILNEKYIKKYIIIKKEDFYDEKKINFYYIILKFILKNSIYIYQIAVLLNLKKLILKIIKYDNIIYDNMKEDNKDKLQYIMRIIADSPYYFQGIKKKKLKEILDYYKKFLFESKKEDVKIIENLVFNNKEGFDEYLKDYNIAKKMNLRFPIIKHLINSGEYESIKDEKKIKQNIEIWKQLEKMIKEKKILTINKETKKILGNYFKDEKNKNILLKIFNQDELDTFIILF